MLHKQLSLIDEEIENLLGTILVTDIDKPMYIKTLDVITRLIELRSALIKSATFTAPIVKDKLKEEIYNE